MTANLLAAWVKNPPSIEALMGEETETIDASNFDSPEEFREAVRARRRAREEE